MAPRRPKKAKMADDDPKIAQNGPKVAPRWSQDGPKMAPRWPQDGPKMAQDGPRWLHPGAICRKLNGLVKQNSAKCRIPVLSLAKCGLPHKKWGVRSCIVFVENRHTPNSPFLMGQTTVSSSQVFKQCWPPDGPEMVQDGLKITLQIPKLAPKMAPNS